MFIQQTNFGHEACIKCGRVDGQHNSGDHIHQYLEIEMIVDGEIEITVEGRTEIARAGDIAVIPPLRVHSFVTPRQVKMLICTMPSFLWPASIERGELMAIRESHVFKCPEPLWNYLIATDFYNTRTKRSFDSEADRELILRLRATVHLIIAEYIALNPKVVSMSGEDTLSRILIYISEHYTEQITLETVAAALGYSPKYVSNCFGQIHGVSFRAFINSLRVEEAKHRLINTDDTVLSIAIECGFGGESTFHRIFREHTGLTPAEYRRRKRG